MATHVANVLVFKLLSVPGTAWDITVSDGGIVFSQPGSGGGITSEIRRSDLGLGFHFVERLCRMLGWELRQFVSDDTGLWVELDVVKGAAACSRAT